MSVIRNIPISRKFSLAFGVVCLLCTGLGAYTFFTFRDIAAKSQDVSEASLPSTVQLARIQDAIDSVRRYDLALLLCQSQACEASKNAERLKSITAYDEAIKAYVPLIDSQREREQFPKIKDSFARYLEISNRGVALLAAGKKRDASDLNLADSTIEVINEAVVATGECFASNVTDAEDNAAATVRASQRATWINLCATVAIVLLCALTGALLVGEVAPRLKRLMASMERFAAKDLTATVLVTGTDEIGRVGEAFNTAWHPCAEWSNPSRRARRRSPRPPQRSARARCRPPATPTPQSSKTNQIAAAAQEMTATIGEISHNAESAAQRQPRLRRDRRPGRRRDAGRRHHHGEDRRRHQHGVAEKMTSLAASLRGDRQGRQRHPGDQRADQPAGPECRHRSRARRRTWPRLRGRRRRSAPPGRTHQGRHRRDRRNHSQHPGRDPRHAPGHARQPLGGRKRYGRNGTALARASKPSSNLRSRSNTRSSSSPPPPLSRPRRRARSPSRPARSRNSPWRMRTAPKRPLRLSRTSPLWPAIWTA